MRTRTQEVFTAANDHRVLIWRPAMDERASCDMQYWLDERARLHLQIARETPMPAGSGDVSACAGRAVHRPAPCVAPNSSQSTTQQHSDRNNERNNQSARQDARGIIRQNAGTSREHATGRNGQRDQRRENPYADSWSSDEDD